MTAPIDAPAIMAGLIPRSSNASSTAMCASPRAPPAPRASAIVGSVRARANKYNQCSRTCGNVPSRGFQDGQQRHTPPEKEESAAIGGNVLVVAGVRAEKVAEFIVCATEPGR